jgi:hypothetical protein
MTMSQDKPIHLGVRLQSTYGRASKAALESEAQDARRQSTRDLGTGDLAQDATGRRTWKLLPGQFSLS